MGEGEIAYLIFLQYRAQGVINVNHLLFEPRERETQRKEREMAESPDWSDFPAVVSPDHHLFSLVQALQHGRACGKQTFQKKTSFFTRAD